MSRDADFDRWYAARNMRIVLAPQMKLETFGNTIVNYHLVSQLADYPNKVRIREGRLEAHRPLVIVPDFDDITTEGMGEEARGYLEFLKKSSSMMRILQYGYHFKSDNFSEQIVTDNIAAVVERVKIDVAALNDSLAAVVQGEDEPWDVAIVELWRRLVERSARKNIMELNERGELFDTASKENVYFIKERI